VRINEVATSINNIIDAFKQEHADTIEQGCVRDYCELPAAKLVTYGKQHGFDIKKVYGDFIIDNPEYEFANLQSHEKSSMQMQYMDPHNPKDIARYAKSMGIEDEFKKVPHYWNEYKGKIIDLTGYAQFVNTGLANDLNTNRYIKEQITERIGYRGLNKPHDPTHQGHITWYSDDEDQAKQYTDSAEHSVVLVHDIPDDIINRSFEHGFRSERTEVKADDFADRVKRGIIDAFNQGWISKDTAISLVDELEDLELPNKYKRVFSWWQDDATFTNILKKAGYKAIHNVENGIDTYGILS